jgi:hypothetical protein
MDSGSPSQSHSLRVFTSTLQGDTNVRTTHGQLPAAKCDQRSSLPPCFAPLLPRASDTLLATISTERKFLLSKLKPYRRFSQPLIFLYHWTYAGMSGTPHTQRSQGHKSSYTVSFHLPLIARPRGPWGQGPTQLGWLGVLTDYFADCPMPHSMILSLLRISRYYSL